MKKFTLSILTVTSILMSQSSHAFIGAVLNNKSSYVIGMLLSSFGGGFVLTGAGAGFGAAYLGLGFIFLEGENGNIVNFEVNLEEGLATEIGLKTPELRQEYSKVAAILNTHIDALTESGIEVTAQEWETRLQSITISPQVKEAIIQLIKKSSKQD